MSGDTLHAYQELIPRAKAVDGRLARLQAVRDRLQLDLEKKTDEIDKLSAEVVKLSKVEELLRALMDALVVKQVRSIESVVTEGLQTIFFDQDLSFEADVSPKYNKISIEFFIRSGKEDASIPIRGKPLDSFGGGPSSVSSLLLRVLTMLRLKRFPLLLLDETLGAVSEEYTDYTGPFLRAMSEKMGLPVLMITHKPTYLDHADCAYRSVEVVDADEGSRSLQLKKVS